jgi:hypothetical protein
LKFVDGRNGATIGLEETRCVFSQFNRVENGLPQNRLADTGWEPPAARLTLDFEVWSGGLRSHRRCTDVPVRRRANWPQDLWNVRQIHGGNCSQFWSAPHGGPAFKSDGVLRAKGDGEDFAGIGLPETEAVNGGGARGTRIWPGCSGGAAASRSSAAFGESAVDRTAICRGNKLRDAFGYSDRSASAYFWITMREMRRFVNDRLRLKLCVNLREHPLASARVDPGDKKPRAKADEHLRRSREAIPSAVANDHEGPSAGAALRTPAGISKETAADEISHRHQPAHHFGDRSVHAGAGAPDREIIETNPQPIPEPFHRDIPQQGPGWRRAGANCVSSPFQFVDRVVQHLQGTRDCPRNYVKPNWRTGYPLALQLYQGLSLGNGGRSTGGRCRGGRRFAQ